MKTTFIAYLVLGLIGAVSFALPNGLSVRPASAAPIPVEQLTTFEMIVCYGVDQTSGSLIRFHPARSTMETVSPLVDQDGNDLSDVRALARIPNGATRSFYCIPNAGAAAGRLCSVDVTNGSVYAFERQLTQTPVRALAGLQLTSGKWMICASLETGRMVIIDPASATIVTSTSDLPPFHALVSRQNGEFLGMSDGSLWRATINGVDAPSDITADHIGAAAGHITHLSFVQGDAHRALPVQDIESSVTMHGALLGFNAVTNELSVIDPVDAITYPIRGVEIDVQCDAVHALTIRSDPRPPVP